MKLKKSVAIIQPSFLPWRGYFDIIHSVDEFVFFDDVQYTKRDWRNRNRVKGPNGAVWITIPVNDKHQDICKTNIATDNRWRTKVTETLRHCYSKAPYFDSYFNELCMIFETRTPYISDLDISLSIWLCTKLNCPRRYHLASRLSYDRSSPPDEKLVQICRAVGATEYVSGPKAKSYIGKGDTFSRAGIRFKYMKYQYPEYKQLWTSNGFMSNMSVVDLLFNCGPWAGYFIWGHRGEHS